LLLAVLIFLPVVAKNLLAVDKSLFVVACAVVYMLLAACGRLNLAGSGNTLFVVACGR